MSSTVKPADFSASTSRAQSRMRFYRNDSFPSGLDQPRPKQSCAGGGRAENHAGGAEPCSEDLAIAEAVLQGDGQPVWSETFRQLARGSLRLP